MTQRDELIKKAVSFKQDTKNKDFESIPHLMADFCMEQQNYDKKKLLIEFLNFVDKQGFRLTNVRVKQLISTTGLLVDEFLNQPKGE